MRTQMTRHGHGISRSTEEYFCGFFKDMLRLYLSISSSYVFPHHFITRILKHPR